MDYEINDVRDASVFKGITFSGFKKGDVHKEYIKSVLAGKIEPACFWACELICAGHYKDLWNLNIFIFMKYIHIGNPKLAVYLDRRFTNFVEILKNGYSNFELQLRNNDKIRKLFAEITCILCLSKQKHPYEEIKIDHGELNIDQLSEKLKSPNLNYGPICFKELDPKPLFVPYNELIYSLTEKNTIDGCFWVSWIIEYDYICRCRKIKLKAEPREYVEKDQGNIIWMIWDAFFHFSKEKEKIVCTIIESLFQIFLKRYSHTENKKKIFILYFAISLLTETHNFNISIIDNSEKINSIVGNIHTIYKQVKLSETPPDSHYSDPKLTNLSKTIERLEKMESLNSIFIPRKI